MFWEALLSQLEQWRAVDPDFRCLSAPGSIAAGATAQLEPAGAPSALQCSLCGAAPPSARRKLAPAPAEWSPVCALCAERIDAGELGTAAVVAVALAAPTGASSGEVGGRRPAAPLSIFKHGLSGSGGGGGSCCGGDRAGPGFVNFVDGDISLAGLEALLLAAEAAAPVAAEGGRVFVDLGSGRGRAAVGAALLRAWREVRGIELLRAPLREATALLWLYGRRQQQQEDAALEGSGGGGGSGSSSTAAERVRMLCGDILGDALPAGEAGSPAVAVGAVAAAAAGAAAQRKGGEEGREAEGGAPCHRWDDADVVYVCATCFDAEQMRAIARLAERMRAGSCVLTLDKPLPSAAFALAAEVPAVPVSWGSARGLVHVRK